MRVCTRVLNVYFVKFPLSADDVDDEEDDPYLCGLPDDAADKACEDVEPVPSRPIPVAERLAVVPVAVVDIFEVHAEGAADAHEDCAEKRDDADAREVVEAVGISEPFWEECDKLFHCVLFWGKCVRKTVNSVRFYFIFVRKMEIMGSVILLFADNLK